MWDAARGGGLQFGKDLVFSFFRRFLHMISFLMMSYSVFAESSLHGSARSVNVVTSAPFSPYSVATGANDGSVKLWDLRLPPKTAVAALGSHGSAVRALTFSQDQSLPVHVVLGLESGIIFRYDLRVRTSLQVYR